jgi:CRISPR-associated endonuclease Csn1
MRTRFAFDLGTNSIGAAVWRIGPDPDGVYGADAPLELLWAGVRIFKDGRNPKDQKSLAEMRRIPRQARKRRDRFVLRRKDLMDELIRSGLMPSDAGERSALRKVDPYLVRAKALDDKLQIHEVGRAIFHLNQRRGFRSNRKTDKADKDKGKIASASRQLAELLAANSCRTLGEFLWKRHGGEIQTPKPVRARQSTRIRLEGNGVNAHYAFYPTRDMVRHEFDLIWAKQAAHHPDVLTDDTRARISNILFRQRDLKPPKVGRCTFVPDELRLPKALFSVRARDVYERLGHVRITEAGVVDRPLFIDERDKLANVLLYEGKLTFPKLRKILGLDSTTRINFEEAGEQDVPGIIESKILSAATCLGARWKSFSFDEKDALLTLLVDEPDEDKLVSQLMSRYALTELQARECAIVPTVDGYSRLGPTANRAILDALIHEAGEGGTTITYAEAVKRAGWHHSDERDGEIMSVLPYYGQVLERHVMPGSRDPADKDDDAAYWGRIMNPTVHIGLNQLRRVANRLVQTFGNPDQICMELARDLKLSQKQKKQELKANAENRKANEARVRRLTELGVPDNGANRARLRLYEEQVTAGGGIALCPFSGRPIPVSALFSSDIEIEHILPRSRTLDDSSANKVLCYRDMNRIKRGKSPFEAFGSTPEWEAVAARGATLLPSKRWRFGPDAMKKFEGDRGFMARQLEETKHFSVVARNYIAKICNDKSAVYVMPGKMTALLRGKWGLNSILSDGNRKERNDHRHHAIDAITIGATTRSLIQFVATQSAKAERENLDDLIGKIPWPFENFRTQVREKVDAIIVSVKPEHGKSDALHEDTAYGLVRNEDEADAIGNLVRRKPISDLTPGEVQTIRDPHLRQQVQAAISHCLDASGKVPDAKALSAALSAFGSANGIRRVRIGKSDESAIEIRDRRTGAPYKAIVPGSIHHIDIVQLRNGTWKGFAASTFEVNQKGWRPSWERDKVGGKLVMRLHKGDLVELEDSGVRRVKQVVRIDAAAGRLRLVGNCEAGDYQLRHTDKDDPFRWDLAAISGLKARGCVAVRVDEIGRSMRRRTNAP